MPSNAALQSHQQPPPGHDFPPAGYNVNIMKPKHYKSDSALPTPAPAAGVMTPEQAEAATFEVTYFARQPT
jgi:hypothetical protein